MLAMVLSQICAKADLPPEKEKTHQGCVGESTGFGPRCLGDKRSPDSHCKGHDTACAIGLPNLAGWVPHDAKDSGKPLYRPESNSSARLSPRTSSNCTPLSLESCTCNRRLARGASETRGPESFVSITAPPGSSSQPPRSACADPKPAELLDSTDESLRDDPTSSEENSTRPREPELPEEEPEASDAAPARPARRLGPCLCPCLSLSDLESGPESESGLGLHLASESSKPAQRRLSGSGLKLLDKEGTGSRVSAEQGSGWQRLAVARWPSPRGESLAWGYRWDSALLWVRKTSGTGSEWDPGPDSMSARSSDAPPRQLHPRLRTPLPSGPLPPRLPGDAPRERPGSSTATC